MIVFLAKIFIKDYQQFSEPKVRQAYGMLCGTVGICLNICLFIGKFVAGTVSKSISITADAFNNLSDAGSSFIILIGFKLAEAKPDSDHPFGHGRLEYISGLIVSGAIMLMAFELLKSSIAKIIHPQAVEYNILTVAILLISIVVKLYMCFYNHSVGKRLDSAAMRVTATDSMSDACATTGVFLAALVSRYTGIQIDGYCGILVSLFIFYAGIHAARETLNPLLGQPPEPEFVEQIEKLVMAHPEVVGVHDLIVHDYGPGRRMISLHAEVSAEEEILVMHDVIDEIEVQLREELKCDAVIHMDPLVTSDEKVVYLKGEMHKLVQMVDKTITMHDFRVICGPAHTNLIFDVVVPFDFYMNDEDVVELIQLRTTEMLGENHFCVIHVDKAYIK